MKTHRLAFLPPLRSIVLLVVTPLLAGCLSPSMQRQPEISIVDIRQAFVDALGAEWKADPIGKTDIYTDTDFTSATWAVYTGFHDTEHPLDYVDLEIHVFRNSYIAAHQQFPASPTWGYMNAPFYPAKWDYQPPHADSFRIACEVREIVKKSVHCTAEMRYEEYLLYLRVPVTSSFSLNEFQSLLNATDEYMIEFLNSSKLSPGPRLMPAAIQ